MLSKVCFGAHRSCGTAVVAVLCLAGVVSANFLVQPYLQNPQKSSMTIMWESGVSTAGTVDFGTSASYGSSVTATVASSGGSTYIHKAVVTGLTAGTVYHYHAQCGSATSADAVFKTSPVDATASFRILTYGDSHRNEKNDNQTWVTKLYQYLAGTVNPDIVMSTGDLNNSDGTSYTDMKNYMVGHSMNILGVKAPFCVSFGNHDVQSGSMARPWVDYPKTGATANGSYVLQYGSVVSIFIDWNDVKEGGTYDILKPGGWLEQQLQSDLCVNAPYLFVYIHRPTWVERWPTCMRALQKQYLDPLLDTYNVNAVFSGHTHDQEHGVKNGVNYVISGAMSYLDGLNDRTDINWFTQGAYETMPSGWNQGMTNGYVTIDVSPQKADLRFHVFNTAGQYVGSPYGFSMTPRVAIALKPVITSQPVSVTVTEGESASLMVLTFRERTAQRLFSRLQHVPIPVPTPYVSPWVARVSKALLQHSLSARYRCRLLRCSRYRELSTAAIAYRFRCRRRDQAHFPISG